MKHCAIRIGVAIGTLGIPFASIAQDVPWQVEGGTAAVQFLPGNLAPHGIEVVGLLPTAFGEYPMEGAVGFRIQPASTMTVMTENMVLAYHKGGFTELKGGFQLKRGAATVPFYNVRIQAEGTDRESPLVVHDGILGPGGPSLLATTPLSDLNVNRRDLLFGWADLRLSASAAAALGKPELEGMLIGGISLFAKAKPTGPVGRFGGGGGSGFGDNVNADVALWNLSSFSHMGRDPLLTYPNGKSGFSSLTTSCNRGSTAIDWFAPMNENHPVIAQQLYRVRLGRIEQIGTAYLKHGFLATNTGSASCGNPNGQGGGPQLFPGLIDTYGTGNNGDRYYLGPRNEVNPFTGVWTAWGSWFDVGVNNSTPDGQRSLTSTQASSLPPHKNRVEVWDQDLIIPVGESRQYLFEAFYLCEEEINLENQIGCKQTNIVWNGSTWGCSDVGAFISNTAAIEQYVPMTNATKNLGAGDVNATVNLITDLSQGWIYVACNPIRLGGGLWQYEISVFNYTSDRQIREVRIPLSLGLTVTNIGFRDPDTDSGNNWAGQYVNGEVVWATQTFAQNPNANSLKYGSLYNFTFTANVAPGTGGPAILGLFKSGAANAANVSLGNMVGPTNGANPVATVAMQRGAVTSGAAADTRYSDDKRLVMDETKLRDSIFPIRTVVNGTAVVQTPSQLGLTVESSGDSAGRVQIVEFFNFTTNAWDVVGNHSLGSSDAVNFVSVSGAAAANYVQAGTREVRARLSMRHGNAGGVAQYRVDQTQWVVGM